MFYLVNAETSMNAFLSFAAPIVHLAPVVHVNSQVIFDTASDRENTMSGTIPPLVTRFESVAPSRHHHRLDTLKPGGASLV